jgi:hypothetical protein
MGMFDGLFGGGDQPSGSGQVAPWKKQAPYLNYGFDQAQQLYNMFKGQQPYGGSLYSPMNPLQQAGSWGLANYSAGQGQDLANAAAGASTAALSSGQQFGQNAQNIMTQSQQDPTQQIIQNAGSMADNPYMNGMIDAASRDVVRNLNENDLPDLNQTANMSGNTDSSRTGIAQGILQRGAADRVGDIAANLRGGAYNSGLSQASTNYQNGVANQLGANSQVGSALQTGLGGAQGAQQMGQGNYAAIGQAGGTFQNDEQGMLNAALQKWQMANQQPWQNLNNYWNVVGGQGYGGGGGGGGSGGPGILGTLGGIGATLGGSGAFGSGGWLTGGTGLFSSFNA